MITDATPVWRIALASLMALAATSARGDDWPQWRGLQRDNVSRETGLLKEWPAGGPPLLWRVEGIGEGIGSVSVAGGLIFTAGYHAGSEYAVALDERTGQRRWSTHLGPAVGESRLMRWLSQRSPTVDGERVYFATAGGAVACLSVSDGNELWRKDYKADFGGQSGPWGFCDYPLVDGDQLICVPGGQEAAIVALDKQTGAVVWKTSLPEADTAAYAATVVAQIVGVRQYVATLGKGRIGVAAADGRKLWAYGSLASNQNSFTPLVLEEQLLCASGRRSAAGLALLALVPNGDLLQVDERYVQKIPLNHFHDNLLVIEGHIYGTARGLVCIELTAGKLLWEADWRSSRTRMSAFVAADQMLYLRQADGIVKLVEASPDAYLERGSFEIPGHTPAVGATNPVVANGRLYLRDDNQLLCYDVRQDALRPPPPEPRTIALSAPPVRPHSEAGDPTSRSVFVPTPQDIVDKMLELAKVTRADIVYDLGSGDGRIVITAAKTYGCRATGYELDQELAALSRNEAEAAGVASLVGIENADLFTADLRDASVVAVYLLPTQLERLIPQLQRLKPGARVVSHQFEIPGIAADRSFTVESTENGEHKLFLWTAPLKSTQPSPPKVD